jgi:hypothetical protein
MSSWFEETNISHKESARNIATCDRGAHLKGARGTQAEIESGRRAFCEYTPFCNGPVDVKRPLDRHVAELMLLSVVDAKAAT